MHQMYEKELDYHDLLGLFEMLDDGDGEISMKALRRLCSPME